MQAYTVEILNPKALRLLKELAELRLITFTSIKKPKASTKPSLQNLLLEGPVWSEEEYADFLETRASINLTGTSHDFA